MPQGPRPLKHPAPGWYATVMGLTGLARSALLVRVLATPGGLRDGSLPQPETVAAIAPARP